MSINNKLLPVGHVKDRMENTYVEQIKIMEQKKVSQIEKAGRTK